MSTEPEQQAEPPPAVLHPFSFGQRPPIVTPYPFDWHTFDSLPPYVRALLSFIRGRGKDA